MKALLGFKKRIVHLDGRVLNIDSDEQVQPGQVRMIEGEGMPIYKGSGRGNLYVKFKVSIPIFTDEQLDKIETFFESINIQ